MIHCGICNFPFNQHPINTYVEEFDAFDILNLHYIECNRIEPSEVMDDYEVVTLPDGSKHDLPYVEDSQNGIETDREESDSPEYDPSTYDYNSFMDNIESYHDKYPEERTSALDRWVRSTSSTDRIAYPYESDAPQRHSTSPTSPEPQTRSAFVEGNAGFLVQEHLNLELTAKYHRRLLNVFNNKRFDNRLQVGSVYFSFREDTQTVTARCAKRGCVAFLETTTLAPRSEQEQFVLDVIRHGNNHGPDWLINSPKHYIIEPATGKAPLCDSTDFNTECVEVLLEHNRWCHNPKCNHASWLQWAKQTGDARTQLLVQLLAS